jgi:hypothetical protein
MNPSDFVLIVWDEENKPTRHCHGILSWNYASFAGEAELILRYFEGGRKEPDHYTSRYFRPEPWPP